MVSLSKFRQSNYLHLWTLAFDLSGGSDAVHFGHANIHNHYMGLQGLRF